MRIQIEIIKPFVHDSRSDYRVAVIRGERDFSAAQMLQAAKELKQPESVVVNSDGLYYFLQDKLVPYSASCHLAEKSKHDEQESVIELPPFHLGPVIEKPLISYILAVPQEFLISHAPIQMVSAKTTHVIIEIDSLVHLKEIKPNMGLIKEFCEGSACSGFYVFTKESYRPDLGGYHARHFNPWARNYEDPVHGTAAAALSGYLYHYSNGTQDEFTIESGWAGDALSLTYGDRLCYVKVNIDADKNIHVLGKTIKERSIEATIID